MVLANNRIEIFTMLAMRKMLNIVIYFVLEKQNSISYLADGDFVLVPFIVHIFNCCPGRFKAQIKQIVVKLLKHVVVTRANSCGILGQLVVELLFFLYSKQLNLFI